MADTLSAEEVREALQGLPGWSGGTDGIGKSYEFADFTDAIGFVARVALVAERLFHHPDITVSWNRVELRVTSHAAGGVTPRCIELAGKIDQRAGGPG
jgi:4a-hydroxytetrahydrobiopterin dehydratase